MKKIIIILAGALCLCSSLYAQRQPQQVTIAWPDYKFETVKANPITSVKNQASSGTCWAFSAIGFLESEVIRINGIKDEAKYPDLSEFFVVSHSYLDRADKYIRLDGNLTFGAGSEADDVLDVIRDYGIVPNSAMTGMNYGTELPRQAEMDAVLKAYVGAVVRNPNNALSTAWKRGFKAILDEYLGEWPETFVVDGKTYTPETYRDALKINPDDYVSLTSFTHHPFYSKFAIEICDNWRWDTAYNVPIDELMQALDAAINAGYTVAWGADVSDPGFTRDGLAIWIDTQATTAAGSDQAHWVGVDNSNQPVVVPVEKVVTQETRQIDFDNKTMTDDHGMQIYGIAKDQWGNKYYMVKNSWGITGKYDGLWYASEAYVKAQTLDLVFHKDAVPAAIKAKLGIG